MSKYIKINKPQTSWRGKRDFEKKWPLPITSHILCPQQLQRKYYGIFNKHNMSVLENYAEKENLHIFFSELENDMFHNSYMTVFQQSKDFCRNEYKMPLKLNIDTKENFVNSLRKIYKTAEEAVKNFSLKKTGK